MIDLNSVSYWIYIFLFYLKIRYNFIDLLDLVGNCKFKNIMGMLKYDFLLDKTTIVQSNTTGFIVIN